MNIPDHRDIIMKLLSDRVTENGESHRQRLKTNPRKKKQLITCLWEVIDTISSCTLYEIQSGIILNHDDDEHFDLDYMIMSIDTEPQM